MIQIKLIGGKRVSRMMLNLGPELNKMMNKAGLEFLKSVRRGAMIMAPKLTGNLSNSIVIRKKQNKYVFAVESPYGRYVEMGYRPHLVSSSAYAYPGKTIAQVYGIPEGVTLLVSGSRRPNFVRDAFQNAIARLPQIIERRAKQAIQNSKK